ncbi:MAG: glycosyltransferase family 4 protein [Verrucomicrobiia bacterium]|jgi:glycosyltransferase involved in cell wall biosynthesis
MKRVLMVTYYFPPIGGPAVYPMLKFCKYLPQHGWLPTVICGGKSDPDFGPDETLVKEIPGEANVHRIDYPHGTMWRQVRGWLFEHHLGRVGHHVGLFADFPCRFREWAELAIAEAARLIEESRPDVIWTSSPVLSAHFVGLAIKRRFGIPWVADFRDPWVGNPVLMSEEHFPRWQLSRQAGAEAKVARESDRCTFAHPLVAQEFAQRHHLPQGRAVPITCGYDPEDFSERTTQSSTGGRLLIVHTGSFYGEYSPKPLYNALRIAANRKPALLKQLKLVFVGGCTVDFDLDGLEVEVLPRVPHGEAIAWMHRSDVQMVVFGTAIGKHNISGKLFDYLATGRPILAIVPGQGSCAEIVRKTKSGLVADPDSPEEIIYALETLIRMKAERSLRFDADSLEVRKFSYPVLSQTMAKLFDECAGMRRA